MKQAVFSEIKAYLPLDDDPESLFSSFVPSVGMSFYASSIHPTKDEGLYQYTSANDWVAVGTGGGGTPPAPSSNFKGYVGGQQGVSFPADFTNELYEFDQSTKNESLIVGQTLSADRFPCYQIAIVGTQAWVMAGRESGGIVTTVDLVSSLDSTPTIGAGGVSMLTGVQFAAGVGSSDNAYLFGGYTDVGGTITALIQKIDPTGPTASSFPLAGATQLEAARGQICQTLDEGTKGLVGAGAFAGGQINVYGTWDYSTENYSANGSLSNGRQFACGTVHNDNTGTWHQGLTNAITLSDGSRIDFSDDSNTTIVGPSPVDNNSQAGLSNGSSGDIVSGQSDNAGTVSAIITEFDNSTDSWANNGDTVTLANRGMGAIDA